MLIYLTTSIIGMILFSKEKVIDTVLENFEQTLTNPDASTTVRIIMLVVLVSFLISAIMSIPLYFFSFKYTVMNFILFCKKNLSNNKNTNNKELFLQIKKNDSESNNRNLTNDIFEGNKNEKLLGDQNNIKNNEEDKLNVNNIFETNNQDHKVEDKSTVNNNIESNNDNIDKVDNLALNNFEVINDEKEDKLEAKSVEAVDVHKIEKLTEKDVEAVNDINSNINLKIKVQLSDCEEKMWAIVCYVFIVVVTLLIEKLEIVRRDIFLFIYKIK